MPIRVINKISADDSEKLLSSTYMEFMGGLGDVIIRCHHSTWYESIVSIDKPIYIGVISHNPHSKELFMWHPTKADVTIVDLGFHPWNDTAWRKECGIPPVSPDVECRQISPILYYPSDADKPFVNLAKLLGKYIALATSAGIRDRFIPDHIITRIIETLVRLRVPVVWIGRDYRKVLSCESVQDEIIESNKSSNVSLDLRNKLTAPGTAEIIVNSSGLICTHSALCPVAQYGRKPFFLLYPREVFELYVWRGARGYMEGIDRPENDHMEFGAFTEERLNAWVTKIVGHRD